MCRWYVLWPQIGIVSILNVDADGMFFGTKLVPNFGTKLVPKFRTIIDSRIPIFFEFRVRKNKIGTKFWYQIGTKIWNHFWFTFPEHCCI